MQQRSRCSLPPLSPLIVLVIIVPKGQARKHATFAFSMHIIPLALSVGLTPFLIFVIAEFTWAFVLLSFLALPLVLPIYSLFPLSSIALAVMAGVHARVTPSPPSPAAPMPPSLPKMIFE